MENVLLGIVLLNYNTSNDVINAINSIVKFTHIPYRVCIVDNNSTEEEKRKLKEIETPSADVLFLSSNGGYGNGNNDGIKYLVNKYAPKYLLIMNPDVTIITDNTIDDLVLKLENSKHDRICGIQPLVWTPRLGNDANMQINIRSVMSYWDCCISSFHILGLIFKKRSARLIYKDEMPYVRDLKYEVPSGCFFIVNAELFKQVGYFDPNTFLYNEEVIIGYKFNQLGYKFLLSVDHKVQHEQGVSTGQRKNKVSSFVKKWQKHSLNIYMKDYLKVGSFKIMLADMLIDLNYLGQYVKYNILKRG